MSKTGGGNQFQQALCDTPEDICEQFNKKLTPSTYNKGMTR